MSPRKKKDDGDNVKFEEGLARLEQIMESLESGQLTLDDSISRFEEGAKLYLSLAEKLDSAEGKVRTVLENFENRTVSGLKEEE